MFQQFVKHGFELRIHVLSGQERGSGSCLALQTLVLQGAGEIPNWAGRVTMRRILLTAAMGLGAAVPIGAAVVAAAPQVASAAGSSVQCSKLTGTATGSVTISKCAPANKQYKSATAPTASLAGGGGTITWAPSGNTSTITVTFKQATKNRCGSGTEYDAKGKVTGGTANYTKTGDKVKVDVCLSSSGNVTLVPGTKAAL